MTRTLADLHDEIVSGGVPDPAKIQAALSALSSADKERMFLQEMGTAEDLMPALWAAIEAAFPIPTPHVGFACMIAAARFSAVPGAALPRSAFMALAGMIYDAVLAAQTPGAEQVPHDDADV